ncbi:MAG: phospholipid carrier-dependent glycosyltransferase [Oscillatoriales cyanobacterium]|nr:MAG: phospholipid carrier-dependent glycosyltransferase [Oscillatoriales cyanobacterium]
MQYGFMKPSIKTSFAAIAVLGVLFFAFVCRFWGLSRFNEPVFDEVYFATYGYDYLKGIEFFDVHPPLGKYIIAIGLWIFQFLPIQQAGSGTEGISSISSFGYRWIGAAFGTFIPLWVGILAYKIGHRVSFGIIAGMLTALDGLLLVESRYALINTYLLTFGLLGLICFLMAVDRRHGRTLWLILAGINLGACWAVKWNGLGFLMTVYGFYGLALILSWLAPKAMHDSESFAETPSTTSLTPLYPSSTSSNLEDTAAAETAAPTGFLATLHSQRTARIPANNSLRGAARIPLSLFALTLAIVPAIVYRISWVYHLKIAPKYDFWEVQQQIMGYHSRLGGNVSDTHPYCSPWYSWPWMVRPVGYYFETWQQDGQDLVTDVHAFGTPVLWWFATLAICGTLLVVVLWLWRIGRDNRLRQVHLVAAVNLVAPINLSVGSFIAIGYGANFFPWMLVSRCTYIYHYMGASLFSFLALAWVLDRVWQRPELHLRAIAPTVILICFAAFLFWSPIFFGLPLSREAFDLRMWMSSWY